MLRAAAILILACCNVQVMAGTSPDAVLTRAMEHYDAGEYETAVSLLEQALDREAAVDSGHYHLLGRAYGRIAEQAGWFKAMSYARKTRAAFEQAVQLDPDNTAAWRDLMEYYRQAPAFLGGDTDKADEIEKRLSALEGTGSQQ